MKIALTGTMSCGKSTLAKALHALPQFQHYELATERSKYLRDQGIELNADSTFKGQLVFAAERALERLRLKVCSEENNCTIQLKETGNQEQAQLAYEMKIQKQARILGLFKTRMQVFAEVNAENGEVIRTGKPWWAFLASESME